MQDNSIYDNIKWYQWNYMQSKSCERIKPFTETLKKKKKKFGLFCWRKKKKQIQQTSAFITRELQIKGKSVLHIT